MIERLAVSRDDALLAVVAALACLSASFVCCPLLSVRCGSKAGVEITAAIPSLGQIMVSTEDDDREFQEDDLELCGLPGVRPVSPPTLTLSLITPPQGMSRSALTPRRSRYAVDGGPRPFGGATSGPPARGSPGSPTPGCSPQAILAYNACAT